MSKQNMTTRLLARLDDTIGWITFNDPEHHNALAFEMWAALPARIDELVSNGARVIVLHGAGGKAFVSGANIGEFDKLRNSVEQVATYNRTADRATEALRHCAVPTIAMIAGICMGAGAGIAVACDMRYASDDSMFGIPAARLGLGYAYDGMKPIVDLVGLSVAKEMFFTARRYNAAEALGAGLVNRVFARDELEPFTRRIAAEIAANAPLTIRAAKLSINETVKPTAEQKRAAAQAAIDACYASADYREGRTAFAEKRKPAFKGR
ncbi:MAG: enoyl-CoA hydratase [Alphaproteobacteria bacterium]